MLGVVENPLDTPADAVMRDIAGQLGVEHTFQPTPVAVFFGEPGVEVEDPYFGGAGPNRTGCVACGNCMVGCRYDAKNTLDRNYLWFAERNGAQVHAEQQVVDLQRVGERWRVTARSPGWSRRTTTYDADQVVFSAGALGTTRLLLELVERGRLPDVSPRLGFQARTNSEALVGAVADGTDVDYSSGIAITSSIHPKEDTHIEPVRYGRGSNVLGLLATILVDGGPDMARQMRFLRQVARAPLTFLRSLSVRRWSERTVILLVMQSRDNSIRMLRRRGLFGSRLTTTQGHGEPNPTYIPEANDAARRAAEVMGGKPMGSQVGATNGKVTFKLKVQAPPWVDVSTVQVIENGKVVRRFAVDRSSKTVRLEKTLEMAPRRDSWYLAVARGRKPLTTILHRKVYPMGLTNPIWVDVDLNGKFDPPGN